MEAIASTDAAYARFGEMESHVLAGFVQFCVVV